MYNRPPDYGERFMEVEDIIGPAMDLLKRHYELWSTCKIENIEKHMKNKMSESDLNKCAAIYAACRRAGYYPAGVDEHGAIRWKVRLKSDVQLDIERNADHYFQRGLEKAGGDIKLHIQGIVAMAEEDVRQSVGL